MKNPALDLCFFSRDLDATREHYKHWYASRRTEIMAFKAIIEMPTRPPRNVCKRMVDHIDIWIGVLFIVMKEQSVMIRNMIRRDDATLVSAARHEVLYRRATFVREVAVMEMLGDIRFVLDSTSSASPSATKEAIRQAKAFHQLEQNPLCQPLHEIKQALTMSPTNELLALVLSCEK